MKSSIQLFAVGILFLSTACKTEGVKKTENGPKITTDNELKVDSLEMDLPVTNQVKLDNGIEIQWIEKTEGESIQVGDVIMIDYKVRLKDSTIIDGNHLLNKRSFPFMVGFGLQPKGWDIALAQLKVGDFARIKIPSELARGAKEVKNLIPKNSENYLTIRVLSKRKPDREIDGNKVWIIEQNLEQKEKFNETNQIVFHSTISSPSSPFYYNSFNGEEPFQLRLEDNGTIPGLKKALINAKRGDRLFVYVPASEGYDTKGYLNLVKANEPLFYNLLVMEVQK